MALAVDFETYYLPDQYDIKTLGVDAYCADDRFDPYLVSVHGEKENGKIFSYVGEPQRLDWSELDGEICLAHNARFDETVFLAAQKKGIISPSCKPKGWMCTADMAVYMDGPRNLKGASKELLQLDVSKETRTKMAGKTLKDAIEKGFQEELFSYAAHDASLCYELYKKYIAEWPSIEQKISRKNTLWGRKGVPVNEAKLNAGIETLEQLRFEAGKLIPWEWDPERTPLSANAMREECGKKGIPTPESFAQDDEECQAWEDKWGAQYSWIRGVRDWRRTNMLLQKLKTIRTRLRSDGTFPYSLLYFGAHTGRFSGADGFNIQNLPRGPLYGVDVRNLFEAPEGYKFAILDYAQIEARIILWLAKDWKTLDMVRQGTSLYEADAIREGRWDLSRGSLKEHDDRMYRMYKSKRLGCGYACGGKGYQRAARILAGLDLELDEAIKEVASFRENNPKIVNLWNYFTEGLFHSRHWDKKAQTYVPDESYEVELPSWRSLHYYEVNAGRDCVGAKVEKGGPQKKLYGGKILENVCQAVARDLLVENLLRVDEAGYDVRFHVHDEGVTLVKEDQDLRELKTLFATVPEWLERCPIDCDMFVSKFYVG